MKVEPHACLRFPPSKAQCCGRRRLSPGADIALYGLFKHVATCRNDQVILIVKDDDGNATTHIKFHCLSSLDCMSISQGGCDGRTETADRASSPS